MVTPLSSSLGQVNIFIWILLFGVLNCSEVLQKKLPTNYFSPSICQLCNAANESQQRLFFDCTYAIKCWQNLMEVFGISWVFGNSLRENVEQIPVGPILSSNAELLWFNAVKALLSVLWFERNQRIFVAKRQIGRSHLSQQESTLLHGVLSPSPSMITLNWKA